MRAALNLTENQTLFETGSDSDVVYLLESGALEAYTVSRGRVTVFGRIRPGEFVGELGVLQGQPRSASVRATEPSRLTSYRRDEFIQLISTDRDHCLKLMHSLSLRTRTLLDLIDAVNQKIHAQGAVKLSFVERWWLGFFRWLKERLRGRHSSVQESRVETLQSGTLWIRPGETLFREGDRSLVACKLLSGKLKVLKANGPMERAVGLVQPGEFVGEIGLLEGTPRSATVRAVGRSEIEVFDQAHLHRLIQQDSRAGRLIIDTLSRRAIRLGHECQRLAQEFATKLDRPSLARLQDLLKSAGEAYEVTGERVERDLQTLQRGLALEAIAVRGMMGTYYRFLKNEVTPAQMEQANAEFRNFLKSLGLGTLFLLPGSPITIPAAIKAARSLGIDILPKNRLAED